ncbi:peptidoglycan DD-metalloendopeptidase family protein [Poritiphilus flavus]|uniref:Peptidoglycan DD-metalloendopeptidase family protein n=1 Tax=Poritiphilus flavus TaxID=2697053 RepID=A0A6L9E9I9_9FLAO|nr:peptidoglycan DD-metalloendopeptidase family protein [Poritiphilus flavus]NAS11313.1 peptidoglycan DD-metalloendopeptidase family protein [Poritiphilus flavus]
MSLFVQILTVLDTETRPVFEDVPLETYTPIDLSADNSELDGIQISDPEICQRYIDEVLERSASKVAYGGYLETRNLYRQSPNFDLDSAPDRDVHLGMDFWAPEGTLVRTPLGGKVHSFGNNTTKGDYGPTIILMHELQGFVFYTLYGHLSVESLDGIFEGKPYHEGSILGSLGATEINVNYAPHLHFQIILNIGEYVGDYPGVCSAANLEWYKANCPDPNLVLNF